MTYAKKQNDSGMPDKKSFISNIHSSIGNAKLELGEYALALQSHQKDLEISEEM